MCVCVCVCGRAGFTETGAHQTRYQIESNPTQSTPINDEILILTARKTHQALFPLMKQRIAALRHRGHSRCVWGCVVRCAQQCEGRESEK
jgi:hypothetical protein